VTVEFGPDELGITVADDGRGFAPEKPDDLATEHLGLLGMRERATRLGGHVQMRSSPDTGTVIEARVPLPLRQPEQTPAPTVRKLD
jgi:signal transduction histidine kinase